MNSAEAGGHGGSVHEQPTVAPGGEAAAPPPVPPAPGPAQGPGAAPGGGYAASPYAAASAYGQYGGRYGGQQPGQPGAGFAHPAPQPGPYGYAAGPGPAPVGYGGWPNLPPSNGKSVAAMVLGIIGLVATVTCWGSFLGIFIAPVALGLGLSAKRAADRGEMGGRGQAVAGFVMGIVGTVLSVLIVAFILIMLVFHEGGPGDSGPGSGEGSSLDARERAASLALPSAADRGI